MINKDNTVLIFDYRNMGAPLSTISPKSNSSLEYCGVSWDRSNSVLFLVGGEYAIFYLEATVGQFPFSTVKILRL